MKCTIGFLMDKFCHAPWMHIYVNPDAKLMPCCLFDDENYDFPNLNDTPLEEALNHPKLVELRKQFLNNEMPKGCYRCEAQISINQQPYKTKMTNLSLDKHQPNSCNSDGTIDLKTLEPTYLDIRFGNLCNLKCRTCSRDFSSAIAQEHNKMFNRNLKVLHSLDQDAIDKIYEKLHSVQNIYLAGGEPLLEENNVRLLEYLIEHNLKPMLCYNTNLTTITFKNKNYFDLWKHFPNIDLTVSIDGYGEVNDYIRFGSTYQTILDNIETVKLHVPQATITINTVASNMSMFSIPKLSKDLIQRNIMNDMMFSICHAPAKFDPTVLTTENKQQITKDFDELLTWLNNEKNIANDPQRKSFLLTFIDRCEGLVSYMNSTDNSDLLDTAKQALAMQDKFRNTDHTKILRL